MVIINFIAGWSSLVARQAHNLKVLGSNPSPAPNLRQSKARSERKFRAGFLFLANFFSIGWYRSELANFGQEMGRAFPS